jgi:hypothetical protein
MATRRLTIEVPEEELERWEAEAKHRGIQVESWARRMLRFVLEAEVAGETTVTLGRQRRLAAEAFKCMWCGGPLGTRTATLRRRYCSDVCRVRAWRYRRQHNGTEVRPPNQNA